MFKCKRESKSEYFKCKCFFLCFFLDIKWKRFRGRSTFTLFKLLQKVTPNVQ